MAPKVIITGRHTWLPDHVVLANDYGAYGDSIATRMTATTLMAMKRIPEYLQMQGRRGWELLSDIQRFEGSRMLEGRPPAYAVDRKLGC